jgi:hypothetical protein
VKVNYSHIDGPKTVSGRFGFGGAGQGCYDGVTYLGVVTACFVGIIYQENTLGSTRPLWQQILFFVLAPPIMALIIRILSRGWANIAQEGNVSETTRDRQKMEFWGVLIFMYLMVGCIFLYADLRR